MQPRKYVAITIWIVLAFMCPAATLLAVQKDDLKKDDRGLPSAQAVIDKYVQALGGYEMLDSRHCLRRTSHGYSNRGDKFTHESYQVEGKYYSRFDYEDGRVIERGVQTNGGRTRDGNRRGVAWQLTNGALHEILGDDREEYLRLRSTVSPATSLMASNESVECQAIDFVNGGKVYRLNMIDFQGTEIDYYFDAESGLLVRRVCRLGFANQPKRAVRDYYDYQRFGDFMVAKKQVITQPDGNQWVYQVEQYEVDVKVPSGTFDVPPGISTTIAKSDLIQRTEKERP